MPWRISLDAGASGSKLIFVRVAASTQPDVPSLPRGGDTNVRLRCSSRADVIDVPGSLLMPASRLRRVPVDIGMTGLFAYGQRAVGADQERGIRATGCRSRPTAGMHRQIRRSLRARGRGSIEPPATALTPENRDYPPGASTRRIRLFGRTCRRFYDPDRINSSPVAQS